MSFKFGKRSALGVAALVLTSTGAQAGGGAGFQFLGGDVSYNGLIRSELAINTGHAAYSNQFGDEANGVPIPRAAGNPLTNWTTVLDPTGPLPLGFIIGAVLPPTKGVSNQSLLTTTDVVTRYVPHENPDLNYHVLRGELQTTIAWDNIALVTRLRVLYEPDGLGYRDFDYDAYQDINGGITGGVPGLYHHTPNHLGFEVEGKRHPLLFERSGANYSVDLPAFFLQYQVGSLTARLGNQSVAWGQLLFFRTFDTANGLDLRRHLILNRAVEEYADVRESAPGLRLTYQLTDQVVVDAFVQQFIPTMLTNPNTPYNVVPSQFTVHDRYYQDGDERRLNEGIKIKGDFGGFDLEGFYTRRYNPLGAIRWTASGVNKPLPNSNLLGLVFNQYCQLVLGSPVGQGCGPQLAKTPFEASPAGVFSAEEWYNYAGYIKLDALDGLNKAVDDFPAAQQLLAQDIGHNNVAAGNELDAFFMAGEGLRGHIERKYFVENVFGLSGGYVLDAEPGSILDQLITHVDVTYTPKRTFTAVDLRQQFDKRDEIQVGLVMEKYQRFSPDFPATYLVFQYLWQKNSDLVGLLNDGYGSENYSQSCGTRTGCIKLDTHVPTSADPKINPGRPWGSNYLVFAFVQPFPNYIYEVSAATLVDPYGGVLFQPGVQWKPQGNVTVNLFYNYLNGHAWGGNANKNTIHLIDFANEVGIRLGYQF
ncbi:MAG: hypothetical protein JWR16_2972 [Nevskia sp.]|nr:hypothetical protein [Nevskia sp.]